MNNNWVATRMEIKHLLGLRDKNLSHLEKWAGIKMSSAKTGYTPNEFARIKKRVSELRRHVTFQRFMKNPSGAR